jgi:hypothetical protein
MDETPIKTACPFCKAEPGRPCKSVEGHKMRGFHNQRFTKKKPREDFSQAAARIVREATKD